jgi:hypothetical protein
MSAAAETLKSAWKQANIEVLTVAHSPDDALDAGCVRGCTPLIYLSCRLTTYKIYQLLYYVDNGASPFPTRAALIKGLTLVHSPLVSKYTLDEMAIPQKLNGFLPPSPILL